MFVVRVIISVYYKLVLTYGYGQAAIEVFDDKVFASCSFLFLWCAPNFILFHFIGVIHLALCIVSLIAMFHYECNKVKFYCIERKKRVKLLPSFQRIYWRSKTLPFVKESTLEDRKKILVKKKNPSLLCYRLHELVANSV